MAETTAGASINCWIAVLAARWLARLEGDVHGGIGGSREGWEGADKQGGEEIEEFHGA